MEHRDHLIRLYFHIGLRQTDILQTLSSQHGIVISLRHLQRILMNNRLFRHKHYSEMDHVVPFIMKELNGCGKLHGYRWMYQKCIQEGLHVRKEDIRVLLSIMDPEGVISRRSQRLRRRAYFSRGPNYIWHFDSYDKLKPFGICINGCVDGFARKVVWLNAYNTSSDPQVIGGYFIEAVATLCGCPCIIRGDHGTENSYVREFQQFFRRNGEDRFGGESSFMYGRSTSNQRIESWWGFLRRECVEFWLELLHTLRNNGHFDGGFLDKNLIIFCFLSLIQDDLDCTAAVWDSHKIRPSRNANVPFGRPNVMYYLPNLHGSREYRCIVPQDEIDTCKRRAVFRNAKACDIDVFTLCCNIEAQHGLHLPKDGFEAVDLYIRLRELVVTML